MNVPDEFGLPPFQRFAADELRHFFVWCTAYKVSDVDLTGGSPISASHFGRRMCCSSATLPTTLISSLIDELFGREVIPRAPASNPIDRIVQISGDTSDCYGLKRGEYTRLCSHLIQGISGVEEEVISMTMRVIPTEIPDILSMSIEPDLLEAMACKSGLGFACDEIGSGKSTLYSVPHRYIMDDLPDTKAVTYEDLVEYILGNENDLLSPHQAEIGYDAVSFVAGLRSTVRCNPEIIGVGEIGDNETADVAV